MDTETDYAMVPSIMRISAPSFGEWFGPPGYPPPLAQSGERVEVEDTPHTPPKDLSDSAQVETERDVAADSVSLPDREATLEAELRDLAQGCFFSYSSRGGSNNNPHSVVGQLTTSDLLQEIWMTHSRRHRFRVQPTGQMSLEVRFRTSVLEMKYCRKIQ